MFLRGKLLRAMAALTVQLFALSCVQPAMSTNAPPQRQAGHAVEVQMRNVMYHFTDSIAVHIRKLHGELAPTRGELPTFDDKDSFVVQIGWAEIAMSTDSLANVLNSYVFAKPDAPLKNISIHIEKDKLKVKGKLHNKGDVSFESEGSLSATQDGKIRLHTEKIKAMHLPVKGMMDMLGVDIGDLIKSGKLNGVQVEKDDLILDPQTLLPAPHIAGPVTAVWLEPNNIVQKIGRSGETMPMRVSAANYMAYRGNQLRFGKLTMSDTDMILIDMDPRDPFDFYLDHYKEQLVAGYTKETLDFGLRVFIRDYNKLQQNQRKQRANK